MSDNSLVPAVPPVVHQLVPAEFGTGDQTLLSEGAKFFTCFDPATHGPLIAACLDGEDKHFDEMIGQEIDLVGFVMHQWESTDPKTGEITDGIRVVLVDTGNRRIGCSGNPVRRALGYFSQFCGRPPWDPPLKVKLDTGKNRAHFRFFKLSLLTVPAPSNGPPAGKKGGKAS